MANHLLPDDPGLDLQDIAWANRTLEGAVEHHPAVGGSCHARWRNQPFAARNELNLDGYSATRRGDVDAYVDIDSLCGRTKGIRGAKGDGFTEAEPSVGGDEFRIDT